MALVRSASATWPSAVKVDPVLFKLPQSAVPWYRYAVFVPASLPLMFDQILLILELSIELYVLFLPEVIRSNVLTQPVNEVYSVYTRAVSYYTINSVIPRAPYELLL